MADEELPDDIRVPTLEQIQGDANNVLGHTNYILIDKPTSNTAEFDGWKDPVLTNFAVSTGGIRDAENQLIWEARYNIPIYEEFKKQVLEDEGWIFLVSDSKDMEPYEHEGKPAKPIGQCKSCATGQVPGYYADFEDPDPEKTQEQIDGNHALLRAIGDCYAGIGRFTAMLNDSAQLYALSDENSEPPIDAVSIS